MQAWTFEGSNNNKAYTMLHKRPICEDLKLSGIGQYQINPKRKRYQYFRIKQTVATISSQANMRISGLDFYGSFIAPKNGCSCKHYSHYFMNIFITVFILVS